MVQFNRPIKAMAVLEIDDWLVIGCDERSHFKVRNISPGEHRIELIEPSRSQHAWWIDTEETGDSPIILTPD